MFHIDCKNIKTRVNAEGQIIFVSKKQNGGYETKADAQEHNAAMDKLHIVNKNVT